MVGGKPTPGKDAVHMDMVVDFLIPGVEDLDDARGCPEILFVRGKF